MNQSILRTTNLDKNKSFKQPLKNGYKRKREKERIVVVLEFDFDLLRALQVVTGGLSELLNHVTSLKPLLHLKSSLVALMTEVGST